MATELDQDKAQAFAGRMLGFLNGASIAQMISIGHQTALFDIMSTLPPSTSRQIAEASGLTERYVREWLGCMVTGRIIDHEPSGETYALPPEHAAWLTRAAGIDNMSSFMQFFPLLGDVSAQIVDCFRNGGGVPYSSYPEFQTLMAEFSGARQDAALVDTILPLVPKLVERMEAGIEVADIGCGQGHAVNLMAKAFPNSRFIGFDFSEEGIANAKAESDAIQLSNTRFEVQDAATLDASAKYDLITAFDAIHDQAHPARVLAGIATALRPEGTFLMVDVAASSNVSENIEHPLGPFLYTVSCMHCMTVSLALDGEGLGAVWGEQKAREMLAAAGFTNVDVEQVEGDILNSYYIARRG